MNENHVIHKTKMTLLKKRGLNENGCGRTDLTKMKLDVHTTKTQKRGEMEPTTFTTKAKAAEHHKMKINVSVPPH
jgi:hypothetical protein